MGRTRPNNVPEPEPRAIVDLDAASDDDQRWFHANPDRFHRVRWAIGREAEQLGFSRGERVVVVVRAFSHIVRLRGALPWSGPLPVDSDAQARRLFDLAQDLHW